MLDQSARSIVMPVLDRAAKRLAAAGVTPGSVTLAGLACGVVACVFVATSRWELGLVFWLLNRVLDGLDGALARRTRVSELGGLLDFVSDFVIYSGFIVAVAIAEPSARLAGVVVLATYLVNNVALLSFSSVIERLNLQLGDGRSLRLLPGLIEGTETIFVYSLICLFPHSAAAIIWFFAALVAITALQRVYHAYKVLSPVVGEAGAGRSWG